MFAYIRQFANHHEDHLLIYCIIHLLTHRSLANTDELKRLTVDNDKLRLFLISEQADYHEKRKGNVIEYIVSSTGVNQELLESLKIFFVGIADQFDQS
jgi:hypothetical protein